MRFLQHNLAPLAVAFAVSLTAWLYGGTRADLVAKVVPWLIVLLLEVLFCFPQRHKDETTYGARMRTWKNLLHDWAFWLSFSFVALLAIPFANAGLCVSCDAARIAIHHLDPAPLIPFLPFCVNTTEHLNVFLWFALALTAMLVMRHSVNSHGKRLTLAFIVWNAVALTAFGFLQAALGAPGPFWNPNGGTYWGNAHFFSVFGYPNIGGTFFTMSMCAAVALWRDNVGRLQAEHAAKDISKTAPDRPRMFWKRHYYLVPATILYFAALNTLSRAAILLATICAAAFFFHAFSSFLMHCHRAEKIKAGVVWIAAFLIVAFVAVAFMPKDLKQEVDSIGTMEVLDRVTGRDQSQNALGAKVWWDYKIFGCGGWGYKHFAPLKMSEKSRKMLKYESGGINVHNDTLQILAEHGLVGFALLVAIVVMILKRSFAVWRKFARAARFETSQSHRLPPPVQLFALPAPAFALLVGALAAYIHSMGDCPFRSPANLALFFVMLAAVDGFVPKLKS